MRLLGFIFLIGAISTIVVASLGIAGESVHHHHHHAKKHAGSIAPRSAASSVSPSSPLVIEFVNNYGGDDVRAYIYTKLESGGPNALITADGGIYKPVSYNRFVPEEANCGIHLGAQGSKTTMNLPVNILEGRIYVVNGKLDITISEEANGLQPIQPVYNSVNQANYHQDFGFIEVNKPDACLWVNPTYVDFTGLPVAFEMETKGSTLNVTGLPRDGIERICHQLEEEQRKDGCPWGDLCIKNEEGKPFRVVSPGHGNFTSYFDAYIEQVWQQISSNGIVFDLQDGSELVSCHISGDSMYCDRTSLPFPKPTSADIWGCNTGPFQQVQGDNCHNHIESRFCAAFHRGTLLLPGGAIQPNQSIAEYYPAEYPHNKYSRILHEVQVSHVGYGFPYDDVKPNFDSEVSGLLASEGVSLLRVFAGGYAAEMAAPPVVESPVLSSTSVPVLPTSTPVAAPPVVESSETSELSSTSVLVSSTSAPVAAPPVVESSVLSSTSIPISSTSAPVASLPMVVVVETIDVTVTVTATTS